MANRRRVKDKRSIEIGRRIARIRRAVGMRQVDLAKAVGLGRSTIAQIEQGYYPPAVPLLDRIAEIFDVEVDAILRDGDLDELLIAIERKRASFTLYGNQTAANELENIRLFTSAMRDIDRMHLPENVKRQIREDTKSAIERAQKGR